MFKKAEKKQQKLRLAMFGPSGSGKTYTALSIAKYLGEKIAVIDTEHGSAAKYAGDVATFDTCELESFEPQHYIEALRAAEGYDVVIVDSLSHAWMGKGGLLDQADKMGGKFQAWKNLTPQHLALIEAIVAHPSHIIATMRSKTEYEVSRDEKGKSSVERLGTAAVQRDGMEYEFDVVGMLDQQNTLTIVKSRCSALSNQAIRKPGAELAATLAGWLSDGAPIVTHPKPRLVEPTMDERIAKARAAILEAKGDKEKLAAIGAKLKSAPMEIQLAVSSDFVAAMGAS